MAKHVVNNGLSVVAIDIETGKVCGGFTSMDSSMTPIPISTFFKMIPSIIKSIRMAPR